MIHRRIAHGMLVMATHIATTLTASCQDRNIPGRSAFEGDFGCAILGPFYGFYVGPITEGRWRAGSQ
jgi:acyl dehydratase